MKKNEPQIGDRRVHVCEHTYREVVQEYVKYSDDTYDWMCMHGCTDEEDAEEVRKFKEQQKEQK